MNKKGLIGIVVVIGVLIVGAVAFMFWPATVSREEAEAIAVEHVGGGHHERAEREFEGFPPTRVWAVRVAYDGVIHEVFVDVSDGSIFRTEVDLD